MEARSFYLCSGKVVKVFTDCVHSKPFNSASCYDGNNNYVAILDFGQVEKYYNELSDDEPDDFWCRECVPGSMDVSKLTLSSMRENGILQEICNKLDLGTERNQAMVIFNLAEKFKCNPIELINKVVK